MTFAALLLGCGGDGSGEDGDSGVVTEGLPSELQFARAAVTSESARETQEVAVTPETVGEPVEATLEGPAMTSYQLVVEPSLAGTTVSVKVSFAPIAEGEMEATLVLRTHGRSGAHRILVHGTGTRDIASFSGRFGAIFANGDAFYNRIMVGPTGIPNNEYVYRYTRASGERTPVVEPTALPEITHAGPQHVLVDSDQQLLFHAWPAASLVTPPYDARLWSLDVASGAVTPVLAEAEGPANAELYVWITSPSGRWLLIQSDLVPTDGSIATQPIPCVLKDRQSGELRRVADAGYACTPIAFSADESTAVVNVLTTPQAAAELRLVDTANGEMAPLALATADGRKVAASEVRAFSPLLGQVVFQVNDSLAPDDTDPSPDLYVLDRADGSVALVSGGVLDHLREVSGIGGEGGLDYNALFGDVTFANEEVVSFSAHANVGPNGGKFATGLFVHDATAGGLREVALTTLGGAAWTDFSITADAGWAMWSEAYSSGLGNGSSYTVLLRAASEWTAL